MYAGTSSSGRPPTCCSPTPDALHRGADRLDPPAGRSEPHPAPDHRGPPARPAPPARRAARFAPRCPYVQDKCREEEPPLRARPTPGHSLRLLVPAGHRRAPTRTPATDVRRRAGHAAARSTDGTGRSTGGTGSDQLRDPTGALLAVEDLVRRVPARAGDGSRPWPASASTSRQGETLGLVGESGCGKSTTGRAVVQVERPPRAGSASAAPSSPLSAAVTCARLRTQCR